MNEKNPPIDEARARELLERDRERLQATIADAKRLRRGEIAEIDQDTDAVEAGEHIVEEEIDDALEARVRAELEAVERAEKRLAEGTYGFSVESGDPIPRERLEAIPWAERTESEQVEHERVHGKPW